MRWLPEYRAGAGDRRAARHDDGSVRPAARRASPVPALCGIDDSARTTDR